MNKVDAIEIIRLVKDYTTYDALRIIWKNRHKKTDLEIIKSIIDNYDFPESFHHLNCIGLFFSSCYSNKQDQYPEDKWMRLSPNQESFMRFMTEIRRIGGRPGVPFEAWEELARRGVEVLKKELATGTLNLKDSDEVKALWKFRAELWQKLAKKYPVLTDETGYY